MKRKITKIYAPPSVRRYARKCTAVRFVKLFCYLLVAYIIVDYIYADLKNTNFGNLSTTVFFIYFVPFVLSGIPMKLFDRDWYGEIIKLELKNNPPEKIDNHSMMPIKQKALIRSRDGKLYEWKIFDEGEYFYGEREHVYNIGDSVIHVRGTDYITPIIKEGEKSPIVCVVCGNKSQNGTEFCRHCGYPLGVRLCNGTYVGESK